MQQREFIVVVSQSWPGQSWFIPGCGLWKGSSAQGRVQSSSCLFFLSLSVDNYNLSLSFSLHQYIFKKKCPVPFNSNNNNNRLDLYGAFLGTQSAWQGSGFHSFTHSHTRSYTHSYPDDRGCHARCQLLISSNFGFSILLKDTYTQGEPGFELVTFRSLDNPLYPLRLCVSFQADGSVLMENGILKIIRWHFGITSFDQCKQVLSDHTRPTVHSLLLWHVDESASVFLFQRGNLWRLSWEPVCHVWWCPSVLGCLGCDGLPSTDKVSVLICLFDTVVHITPFAGVLDVTSKSLTAKLTPQEAGAGGGAAHSCGVLRWATLQCQLHPKDQW